MKVFTLGPARKPARRTWNGPRFPEDRTRGKVSAHCLGLRLIGAFWQEIPGARPVAHTRRKGGTHRTRAGAAIQPSHRGGAGVRTAAEQKAAPPMTPRGWEDRETRGALSRVGGHEWLGCSGSQALGEQEVAERQRLSARVAADEMLRQRLRIQEYWPWLVPSLVINRSGPLRRGAGHSWPGAVASPAPQPSSRCRTGSKITSRLFEPADPILRRTGSRSMRASRDVLCCR